MFWMLLAASTPLHLSCSMDKSSAPVEIALNEAKARASITVGGTAAVVDRPAVFNESEVIIHDRNDTWTVNRKNDSFTFESGTGDQQTKQTGKRRT